MNRRHLLNWLRETDERVLAHLWRRADAVRREAVGDAVHIRGLVGFSNHCVAGCAYCGIRAGRARIERYRMSADEILACARRAVELGYGTLVLESGTDAGTEAAWLADVIRRIKRETPLAVTLCLGERREDELASWREAGADRYLLRFETSNRELYARIHPMPVGRECDRIEMLRTIRRLGYETGSGIMIGLCGQTYEDLANDLELFYELDLDMVDVAPCIEHPDTPLAAEAKKLRARGGAQVPNTKLMTYKVLALTRLLRPLANIPSTAALATLHRDAGRAFGLRCGANVVMPDLTPPAYRQRYEIYPGPARPVESAEDFHEALRRRIEAIGRTIGTGRGDSRNFAARAGRASA